MAVSLAYIWIMHLGITCVLQDARSCIERHAHRDKSLFRLGLDWLTYLLKYDLPLPQLNFKPPPISFGEII